MLDAQTTGARLEDHLRPALHPARAGHRLADRGQHAHDHPLGRGGRPHRHGGRPVGVRVHRHACAPAQRPADRALHRHLPRAVAGGRGRARRAAAVAQAGAQSRAAVGGPGGHHHAVAGRHRHRVVGPEGQGGAGPAVEAAGRAGPRQGPRVQHRHRLAEHRRRQAGAGRAPRRGPGIHRQQDQGGLHGRTRPAPPAGRARGDRPGRDAGHRRQRQVGPGHLPALLPRRRAVRRVLVRGAALVRRRQGACAAGARHAHPGGARRAALHPGRVQRVLPPGRHPLGAAGRHADGGPHGGAARLRDGALVPAAGRAPCRRHEPGARAPELRASGVRGAGIHPVDQGLLHRPGRGRARLLPAAAGTWRGHHADAAGRGALQPAHRL